MSRAGKVITRIEVSRFSRGVDDGHDELTWIVGAMKREDFLERNGETFKRIIQVEVTPANLDDVIGSNPFVLATPEGGETLDRRQTVRGKVQSRKLTASHSVNDRLRWSMVGFLLWTLRHKGDLIALVVVSFLFLILGYFCLLRKRHTVRRVAQLSEPSPVPTAQLEAQR